MRKLSSAATGRLKPLRLFSTLLVVLVSFSVGLISDPILRKITDTGYSYLRHAEREEKGSQTPSAPGQGIGAEEKPVASATA
jgi:hypothetical protein